MDEKKTMLDEDTREISNFRFHGRFIPEYMQEGITEYINHHVPTGGFLKAILENNLIRACDTADETNLWIIPVYVSYLYSCAPSACWGSPEKVAAWVTAGLYDAIARENK